MSDRRADKAGELFRRGLSQLGIDLPEQAVNQLVQYSLELLKWNMKVNLVSKKASLEDVVEKHFLDSLTLLPVLENYAPDRGVLLDVGSGAGFPGLVVKVACPERPVTLMEPRLRRITFLNHIIRLLSIQGVAVVPHRTDDKEVLSAGHVTVITGRAVADVTSFLEMVHDLAASSTLVVCMQGASGREQWESEKNNLRFSPVAIEHIHLPFSQDHRSILVFRKKS